jgi:glycosyltransferase involved in cell wall biosynthesis
MNILVNAIPLTGVLTGIQRYVRCLYGELQRLNGVTANYFAGRNCLAQMPAQADPAQWAKKAERVWQLPQSMIVALRSLHWLYFEQRLRMLCKPGRFDVYHETTFFPPALREVPVVYTLYDLSLIKHREKHPRERVWFFDLFFNRRLPYAAHIVTISEYMRRELIEELGVAPHAVTAIPLAPEPAFFPRRPEDIANVLLRNGWPKEYLLFVGTLEPRKNIALLVRALAQAKTRIPLILAGWTGWGDKAWRQDLERLGLQTRVFVAGYTDEETLACLYSGATALVYPSLYEGFGLPVVEAMACGCPVICSNTTSLPEVAGEAGILIDPHNTEELAHVLERVVDDSAMRHSLRDQGLQRAKMFTWEKTALQTFEVFARVAAQHDLR